MKKFLGFDFGASSGRAMLGRLEDGRMTMEEIHRFPNDPVRVCGRFVWDLPRLIFEMKTALTLLGQRGETIDGIGIDTWGVDFGLLDGRGRLLSLPVHYRDERTNGVAERAFARMSREDLFRETGTAMQPFNTVFQLLAMKEESDPTLSAAKHLLFMPDLLAYCLTGEMGTEFTVASTSQLLKAGTMEWSDKVFEKMGLNKKMMGSVTPPGTMRGHLLPEIARECGIEPVPVYAVASHDTASAVAAAPMRAPGSAYLSSGTWSLLGIESDAPILAETVLNSGYSNEGGVRGDVRLLRNIMGLWILQECRRTWNRQGLNLDFAGMAEAASKEKPFMAFIDADDPTLLPPGDMPSRIQELCRRSGQYVPQTPAEITRIVCESLAFKYRLSIEQLEKHVRGGRRITALHIVGGGCKNVLLNQLTANALNRQVIAGPSEATVIGNLLVQAASAGAIAWEDLRRVCEQSFPTQVFEPNDAAAWDEAYPSYLRYAERGCPSR